MDPIKTRGYAQATGFNPGTAPNTAEQQRRQDQEFIRQFKEAKELELEQEATALNRIKENNRLERQNLAEYSRRKEEYQSQQDRIKLNQLKREQQAQKSVAGMNSSDKKFDDALKLVTDLSKTAFKTAGKLQDEYNTSQEELGKADALQYQAYGDQSPNLTGNLEQDQDNSVSAATADLGGKKQEIATQVIELEQQSQATQIGMAGAPDLEARLKGRSHFYKQGYIKALAGVEGRNFGTTQYNRFLEEQINNPNKTYVVDGEEKRIGEIDISKSENLKKVLQASLPEYIKERGFDRYSSIGLGDFYKNVIASTDQVVGTVRSAEISEQKLDRQDQATSMFQLDPTPINAKLLYTTYNQSGLSNAAARKKMVEQWSTLSEEDFRAMGDMPFGPNGKSFREQYPDEWREAVTARNSYIEAGRQNTKFALESQDEEAVLQFQADYLEDVRADGSFDADPATLSQAAEEAEANGMPKLAKAMRDKIALTKNAQYDKRFLEGLKSDLELGIANYSAEQIADNPSLSGKAKREALAILQEANKFEVPRSVATADKSIINSAIRNRAGVNTFTKGPADPSVKVMEKKAWQRYRKVYKQEFERTGNAEAASKAALEDFQNEFNKKDGLYEVTPPITGANSGKYVNGIITGKAYSSGIKLEEVNIKVQQNGQAAFTQPDLYTGEKEELTQMLEGAKTGKITIPQTLQRIQDNSGGSMSMRQLLNQRLKANGLEEIPQEVGKLADEVEQSFDPRYNKYLNYKPSFVRTDIAMIGSGQDPIYQPNLPANVRNDTAFQAEVSAVAQRLGIREGDLYAVMHFETGGSFDPAQPNLAGSGATGLIQIMPSTAPGLGTTTDALAKMTRAEQMAYVEKYLKNAGVKPGMGLDDLYMSILFPAAMGKSDDFVLFGRGAIPGFTGRAYTQNAGLDKNGDGSVTRGEALVSVRSSVSSWRQPLNVRPQAQQQVETKLTQSQPVSLQTQVASQKTFYKKQVSRALPTGLTGPVAPEAAPNYYVIGDSLAVGATGTPRYANNPNGTNNSDAQVGRSPQQVLSHLKKYTGLLTNADITLSTGALNNQSNWKDSVVAQLDFLRNEGVRHVNLIGFPNTPKFSKMRKELNAIAKQYGFSLPKHYSPGADGIHPANYKPLMYIPTYN